MIRLLWSHCRDIQVNVFEKTIKYSIPIYSEDGMIGKLLKAKLEFGRLDLTFERKEPPKQKQKQWEVIEKNED